MEIREENKNRSETALRCLAIWLALVALAALLACGGELPEATLDTNDTGLNALVLDGGGVPSGAVTAQWASEQRSQSPPAVIVSDHDSPTTPPIPATTDADRRSPQHNYEEGFAAWKKGDLGRAELHLRAVVREAPEHVQGRINLARVLIERGKIAEATEHALEADGLDPGSTAAKRTLARALVQGGDCSTALALYEEALAIDVGDIWSLNNMGHILIDHGRHADAVGPLALAVSLAAENALFRNNLGVALEGAGYPIAAYYQFLAASELDPGHIKANSNRDRLIPRVEDGADPEVGVATLARDFHEQLADPTYYDEIR